MGSGELSCQDCQLKMSGAPEHRANGVDRRARDWKTGKQRFIFLMTIWFCFNVAATCPTACVCKWKGGKQTVECKNQGLASLPSGIHADTQVLDMSGNNLQALPRHAFARANLNNLQRLYLRDCKLGQVDPSAFSQLTNLVELDLSDNLLTEIPSVAFSNVPSLRELFLKGNRFKKIHGDSFVHLTSLVRLDLSFCGIRTIAPTALQPMTLLEKLRLQGNAIAELPGTVIKSLEGVHSLEVHDNPWLCDCRALPLWRLLEQQRVPHLVSPMCAAPARVASFTFHTMNDVDFSCPPEILPIGRFIEGVAGENASIVCPVGGQPPPQVVWYMGDVPVLNGSLVGVGPQRAYFVSDSYGAASRLIITGAQETDSGTFRCVAINSAGSATANFTLAVTMRSMTPYQNLDSGHIAGIAVGFVMFVLVILSVGFLWLARSRSQPSPVPEDKSLPPSVGSLSPTEPNPVQKPPRLTEIPPVSSAKGAGYGPSALRNNPDVISDAERAERGQVNGHVSSSVAAHALSDVGEYTRVEGDSLYPSGIWDDDDSPEEHIHEHFNPGFDPNYDTYGPAHSTPYRYEVDGRYDPQIYGYPADYGLPIPEVGAATGSRANELQYAGGSGELHGSRSDGYSSRDETFSSQHDVYSQRQEFPNDLYGSRGDQESSRIGGYGRYQPEIYERVIMEEGEESPTDGPPAERPWIPGSQAPPVPRGVQVLPPLPPNFVHRLKSRDSPDEGYQEGTDV